jgi:iron complex outermembrane receptor protein
MHKVNAGVQVRAKAGVEGELALHYVSPQTWAEQVVNIAAQRIEYQPFHVDAYYLVNARVGYRFLRNQAEASVMGFNLLDNQHREHPFGQVIGRRVMAFFTYRF